MTEDETISPRAMVPISENGNRNQGLGTGALVFSGLSLLLGPFS